MLKSIANLLDFDFYKTPINLIIEEFNHKFSGTYMLINGKSLYIDYLESDRLLGGGQAFTTAIDIKPIVPKSGLYRAKNSLYYGTRLPKKQWSKSLKLDINFKFTKLDGEEIHITQILNSEFFEEACLFKNNVFIHNHCVGTYDDLVITLLQPYYCLEKECKELFPQYTVITVVNNPPIELVGPPNPQFFVELKLN